MSLPLLPRTSLTIEDVARLPLPGMAIPAAFDFRPNSDTISYLYSPDNSLFRSLYQYDPKTNQFSPIVSALDSTITEEDLPREERLRRERSRQYELGVTSYAWSPDGNSVLIPLPDGLYLWREKSPGLLRLSSGRVIDPKFSPNGQWIAYIQSSELYILPGEGGDPRQLTNGATENGLSHGLAEYIAQEEMGRNTGYWWSPDSQKLAFTEVDERHIPVYRILHQGKSGTGPDAQEDHHFPFAGGANANVRLGVIPVAGGEPVWMDLGRDDELYLVRVAWFSDGTLAAQVENREQSMLRLLRLDPASGKSQLLLSETNPTWINLNNLFKPLKDGRFLWGSERSGFQHLYLYAKDGTLLSQLTGGDWIVDSLVGVDEQNNRVYITGTRESPLECHLYSAPLEGGEAQMITQSAGVHNVVIDVKSELFIDTFDSLNQPPIITLRSLEDGGLLSTIHSPVDPRLESLDLQPPKIVSLPNRTGTTLYGLLYKPGIGYGDGPYPTIIQVYGGPHSQQVTNGWRSVTYLRAQYLRSLGFLVFILDNRGSARRGLEFEGGIKHRLGELEAQDQADGVRWLIQQGLADPGRVGVYGWSYGGYMALLCLGRYPELFKAAVAGAPVTAWDGYDTHYTERYMGLPLSNPQGYHDSAVFPSVENMRGRLLLVHGLIDENVHFRHTARLINYLIKARKPYELLLFPDERHGPRRLEDRIYLEERIRDFFVKSLKEGK